MDAGKKLQRAPAGNADVCVFICMNDDARMLPENASLRVVTLSLLQSQSSLGCE